MSLFEIKNVNFKYDKYSVNTKNVLNDISFSIDKGDFLAIIGTSGCGKSTLITHLNGILKADSGVILYDGKNIYDKDFELKKLRFECGLVFQYPEYQLFEDTVIDDICFGAIKKGADLNTAKKYAVEIMEWLGIEKLMNESPFILSGGEKRKVALAGVLVMKPKVLVLDEPEAGLDTFSKNELFKMLKKLNADKETTIIFVTHDLDDAAEYSNKVLLLSDGKVLNYGETFDVLIDNEKLKMAGLDMPYSIEIMKAFMKYGINFNKTHLIYDNMKMKIYEILKNKKK